VGRLRKLFAAPGDPSWLRSEHIPGAKWGLNLCMVDGEIGQTGPATWVAILEETEVPREGVAAGTAT